MTAVSNLARPAMNHPWLPAVPRSRPISTLSRDGNLLDYITYIPANATEDSPVLICLHGLKRNPTEQIFRLSGLAEKIGCMLLAPHFSRNRFKYYQTLSPDRDGNLAEDLFDATLDDFAIRFRHSIAKIGLFGFSGGGQFAHRYAMLGRREIDQMAIVAPGWFTLPDPTLTFPYGTGPGPKLGERTLDPERLIGIPTLLLVGSRDKLRGSSLNTDPVVDETQGKNRVERAQTWMASLHQLAQKKGAECRWTFQTVKGSRHNFSKMIDRTNLGERLENWFTNNEHNGNWSDNNA